MDDSALTQMNYLETERLILRPFAEQDTESLFIILSDVEVNAFLPMFPLKDIEEAKTYLQKSKFCTSRNLNFVFLKII